jgi:hypothetical protein
VQLLQIRCQFLRFSFVFCSNNKTFLCNIARIVAKMVSVTVGFVSRFCCSEICEMVLLLLKQVISVLRLQILSQPVLRYHWEFIEILNAMQAINSTHEAVNHRHQWIQWYTVVLLSATQCILLGRPQTRQTSCIGGRSGMFFLMHGLLGVDSVFFTRTAKSTGTPTSDSWGLNVLGFWLAGGILGGAWLTICRLLDGFGLVGRVPRLGLVLAAQLC